MRYIVPNRVIGPIPSKDGQALETIVQADLGGQGFNRAGDTGKTLVSIARSDAGGMHVYLTGPLGNAADNSKVFKGIDSTLLIAALAVVIVILLITYRSPVLWVLPVLCSGGFAVSPPKR